MDSEPLFHWCASCQHPVYTSRGNSCPTCGGTLKYLATNARPVFARERRILQFYGFGPLTRDVVVIVIHIWQKLSNVEHKVTLIATDFWQLFSRIFGETPLVSSYLCGHGILFLSMLSTSW